MKILSILAIVLAIVLILVAIKYEDISDSKFDWLAFPSKVNIFSAAAFLLIAAYALWNM